MKENIIKTAFDIYCNLIYGRQYPFTINNMKLFFEDIKGEMVDYLKISRDGLFGFSDGVYESLLKSHNLLEDTSYQKFFNHFIEQHDNNRNNT